MVMTMQDKVTVILNRELKEDVAKLKEQLHVSMNTIYQTAIEEYVAKKKSEKIRQEAKEMVNEYKNNLEMKELSDFEEDLYEY